MQAHGSNRLTLPKVKSEPKEESVERIGGECQNTYLLSSTSSWAFHGTGYEDVVFGNMKITIISNGCLLVITDDDECHENYS